MSYRWRLLFRGIIESAYGLIPLLLSIFIAVFLVVVTWPNPDPKVEVFLDWINKSRLVSEIIGALIPIGFLYVAIAFIFVSKGDRSEDMGGQLLCLFLFTIPLYVLLISDLILSLFYLSFKGKTIAPEWKDITTWWAIFFCAGLPFLMETYMAFARAAEDVGLSHRFPHARRRRR